MPPSADELVEYDDLLSNVLVDRVFFWSSIHKVSPAYRTPRSVVDADVIAILRDYIKARRVPQAVAQFTSLPGIRKITSRWDDRRRSDFCSHLRKYLRIWAADAGFDIGTTRQYDASHSGKLEACIIARRTIQRGQGIPHLTGTTVGLSPMQEATFKTTNRDFSILYSSRGGMRLFLGPARFVNHDCEPNARFVTEGSTVQLVAQRDIAIDEEITTFYGAEYFGKANCDCLCHSCQGDGRGAYSLCRTDLPVAIEEQMAGRIWERGQRRRQQHLLSPPQSQSSIPSRSRSRSRSPSPLSNCDSDLLDHENQTLFTLPKPKVRRRHDPVYGILCACRNCASTFWHPRAVFLPATCGRCRRHSKLYGYGWPKRAAATNDTEEYIDDFRSVEEWVRHDRTI